MSNTKLFKCNVCPAEFKTQRGLDNHKHRWICPVCGSKLKTQKGYDKHLENHKKSSFIKQENEQNMLERQKKFEADFQLLKEHGLFSPKYEAGDKVILSTYHITKPTHQKRFNRMVRVRYEEERRYYADVFVVRSVIIPGIANSGLVDKCIKNNEQYPIRYITEGGKTFSEKDVFAELEKAKENAKQSGEEYKKACEFASMCR